MFPLNPPDRTGTCQYFIFSQYWVWRRVKFCFTNRGLNVVDWCLETKFLPSPYKTLSSFCPRLSVNQCKPLFPWQKKKQSFKSCAWTIFPALITCLMTAVLHVTANRIFDWSCQVFMGQTTKHFSFHSHETKCYVIKFPSDGGWL